ncbi:inactive poly [ADP-ribose] polymerase RCD1-like [Lotus japonicus]|uniref:inactive poly [ADP-ribose] polymerase RCD1-like n=1 Tax=Lotus japonicus TaxID=34305 RepID=UPI00258595FA|nr:inactive poly [ADP-ribose] polymerase RCD1-like [Lotus japonicus]
MKSSDYERKMITIGSHSGQSFLRYYLKYKKIERPERVMLYNNEDWLDYPRDVVDLVKNAFKIKKEALEIRLNGHDLMLDFLHMCQVDLSTSLKQPIAWIDEAGSCFFPEVHVASNEESYNLWEPEFMELSIETKANEVDESKLRQCSRESSGGESILQNHVGLVPYNKFVQGKLVLDSVQEMFLNGMNSFGNTNFEIVETYHCSGASMQARLELFRAQAKITKIIHGDANVRYAWLHFSKEELSTMIDHGLGHCVLSTNKSIYGVGVHLSAVSCPYASARYCHIDENGVRHLVLCRVIMGNMEVLHPSIDIASSQFQPRNFEYDNRVDDIQCPRYYLVWNMNINSHIYPEFVVSFKVNEESEEHFCGTVRENNDSSANSFWSISASHVSGDMLRSASSQDNGIADNGVASTPKIPISPWLPFPMLIVAINDKVPASDMSFIKSHYELYKIPSNDKLKGSNRIEG